MHGNYISVCLFIFADCFRNFINLMDLVKYLAGKCYHYHDPMFTERQFYNNLRSEL